MASFLSSHPKKCRLLSIAVDDSSTLRKPTIAPIDFVGEVKGISSFLTLATDVGKGRGIVRLCKDTSDGQWKAFTLFTTMHELKGHEEALGTRRPDGVQHGGNPGRKNWKDRREIESEYADGREPTVLIIGMPRNDTKEHFRKCLTGVRCRSSRIDTRCSIEAIGRGRTAY
jgi:hypothetical protein